MPEAPCARVLVVENEAPARQVLCDVVEMLGHIADEAPDGRAALARFQSAAYGAVVTDFVMPGLNGLEVARIIRRLDPHVGIIMVSGSNLPVAAALEEFGIEYLRKPLDFTSFADALSRAILGTLVARATSR